MRKSRVVVGLLAALLLVAGAGYVAKVRADKARTAQAAAAKAAAAARAAVEARAEAAAKAEAAANAEGDVGNADGKSVGAKSGTTPKCGHWRAKADHGLMTFAVADAGTKVVGLTIAQGVASFNADGGFGAGTQTTRLEQPIDIRDGSFSEWVGGVFVRGRFRTPTTADGDSSSGKWTGALDEGG